MLQHVLHGICRDDQGRTALHWAAAHGLHVTVDVLLEGGEKMQKQELEQLGADEQPVRLPSLKLLQVFF